MNRQGKRHITRCSSFIFGGMILLGSILTGCEKEQVPEDAGPRVQLIPMNDTLRQIIAENTLLTNTHCWYIEDWVFVANETTLTIEPGTIIKIIKKKDTGGGLVITRGAKIIARGLDNWPILFRLSDTVQDCNAKWSGIVLLGKAPQKHPYAFTDNITATSNSSGWAYGGEQPDDSSGVLQHVRIITTPCKSAVTINRPLDGLLLMGVGRKTIIKDVVTDTARNSYYRIENTPLK